MNNAFSGNPGAEQPFIINGYYPRRLEPKERELAPEDWREKSHRIVVLL